MEQEERDLWKTVDVGGYAAVGTLFSFTLEGIKTKVESDDTNLQELRDRIKNYYEKLANRFEGMNLNILDKRFPVNTLNEIKSSLVPEMGKRFTELEVLLKHFVSGATHLKFRISSKINDCQKVVKQMGELGIKFSKNERYWEYRNTNPERVYITDKEY